MSRRYNDKLRLERAYTKYLEAFETKMSWMRGKNLTPADSRVLSYNDFIAQRKLYAEMGVKSGNITSKIIYTQMYHHSQVEASNLVLMLQENDLLQSGKLEGDTVTARKLMSDLELWDKSLSALNEELKARGISSGYARANYIGYWVFDSN